MTFIKIKQISPVLLLLFLMPITYIWVVDPLNRSTILNVCSIITAVVGVVTIYMIYKELLVNADIANAEFLLKLDSEFFNNEEIRNLYKKLDMSYNECFASRNYSKNYFSEKDRMALDHYLCYFNLLANLLERNVSIVNMNQINEIFAYRFFIAVHNPEFQNIEFVKNRRSYMNIFRLYDRWLNYRHSLGQTTVGEKGFDPETGEGGFNLKIICDDYDNLISPDVIKRKYSLATLINFLKK